MRDDGGLGQRSCGKMLKNDYILYAFEVVLTVFSVSSDMYINADCKLFCACATGKMNSLQIIFYNCILIKSLNYDLTCSYYLQKFLCYYILSVSYNSMCYFGFYFS